MAPISAPMLQIVALPVAEIDSAPGPKYSTIAPVPPFTVRMPATLRMTSFGAAHPESEPCRCTPISFGTRVLYGQPAITSTASAPPTPIATMPSPPAFGVWLSVPIIIPPGNAYCSSTTWWMMPEPGFQKPMPYFAETVRRNSYTSEFTSTACLRSMSAPTRAWMRWSQWTVDGTCTVGRPAVMNWSSAICAVASCMATRSGR